MCRTRLKNNVTYQNHASLFSMKSAISLKTLFGVILSLGVCLEFFDVIYVLHQKSSSIFWNLIFRQFFYTEIDKDMISRKCSIYWKSEF